MQYIELNYVLIVYKHTGSNDMHEHVKHAQHVKNQSKCIGVTPVQIFSLVYI